MALQTFWRIVDDTLADGDRDKQAAMLKQAILEMSAADYGDFMRGFFEAWHEMKSRDEVFNAAYLAFEQCLSSDTWDYFCYWLIGSGSMAYQRALKNPDVVVELMREHGFPSSEEFAEAISVRQEEWELEMSEKRSPIRQRLWDAEEQRHRLPLLFAYAQT